MLVATIGFVLIGFTFNDFVFVSTVSVLTVEDAGSIVGATSAGMGAETMDGIETGVFVNGKIDE